ncbi:MAG: hypothetical protein M3132_14930, partial [Actinomycetia bacterium]|nr:hypothetical protein [Actinomycetes bacterium]
MKFGSGWNHWVRIRIRIGRYPLNSEFFAALAGAKTDGGRKPKTIRLAVSATNGALYSTGGFHNDDWPVT